MGGGTEQDFTDMKYMKTGTNFIIESHESTYDSSTDTETIKLTVKIKNPVFKPFLLKSRKITSKKTLQNHFDLLKQI